MGIIGIVVFLVEMIFVCLWINAHDIVLQVHLLSRSFQWDFCLCFVESTMLCAFERFWNLWNLDVPIYALMPKKYCKRGHLMLPSSPCLPLPHRATLRLPHLNDSRHLAPSNRHNSWDDKIWPSRSQLGFIGITVYMAEGKPMSIPSTPWINCLHASK